MRVMAIRTASPPPPMCLFALLCTLQIAERWPRAPPQRKSVCAVRTASARVVNYRFVRGICRSRICVWRCAFASECCCLCECVLLVARLLARLFMLIGSRDRARYGGGKFAVTTTKYNTHSRHTKNTFASLSLDGLSYYDLHFINIFYV